MFCFPFSSLKHLIVLACTFLPHKTTPFTFWLGLPMEIIECLVTSTLAFATQLAAFQRPRKQQGWINLPFSRSPSFTDFHPPHPCPTGRNRTNDYDDDANMQLYSQGNLIHPAAVGYMNPQYLCFSASVRSQCIVWEENANMLRCYREGIRRERIPRTHSHFIAWAPESGNSAWLDDCWFKRST